MKCKPVIFIIKSAIMFLIVNCGAYYAVTWKEVQSIALMLMPILFHLVLGIIPACFNKRLLSLFSFGASTIGLYLYFSNLSTYAFQPMRISDPTVALSLIGWGIGGFIEVVRAKRKAAI